LVISLFHLQPFVNGLIFIGFKRCYPVPKAQPM